MDYAECIYVTYHFCGVFSYGLGQCWHLLVVPLKIILYQQLFMLAFGKLTYVYYNKYNHIKNIIKAWIT